MRGKGPSDFWASAIPKTVDEPARFLYNTEGFLKMASSVPKPKNQRRNRNPKLAGDWVQLPKEGYQGRIPSVAGLGLNRDSQQWWRKIWRTPMATQWNEGDVPALKELAMLRERFLDGQISVAAEVRLRSDQFGLTPAGRQGRRWMVSVEDLERAGMSIGDEVSDVREQRAKRLAPDG